MSWRPTDEWPDGLTVPNPREVEASLVVAAKETGPIMPGPGRRMRKLGRTAAVVVQIALLSFMVLAPSGTFAGKPTTDPAATTQTDAKGKSADAKAKKGLTDPQTAPSTDPKPKKDANPTSNGNSGDKGIKPDKANKPQKSNSSDKSNKGQEKKAAAAAAETTVVAAASGEPTITSDKADYPPGAKVVLTGTNWQGDEPSGVRIVVNDDAGKSWSRGIVVDVAKDGTIKDQFRLPDWFVAEYAVTATGLDTGRTATTTFTDASIGTYDQCENDDGDGYDGDPGDCHWTSGNLQGNNSTYHEGDATVQRLWLDGFVPGSTHTITLKYGTTKGDKHAYDFLTTWDWSEDWITIESLCQAPQGNGLIDGCTTAPEDTLDIPQDPNVPNGFEPSDPGDRMFVMRGGTLEDATTPVLVVGSFPYDGDTETAITVEFDVADSGDMCTTKGQNTSCGVILWFGAHISVSDDWLPIDGQGGATTIPGSPYHVALDKIDGGSIGQRDNQMQAGAIVATGTKSGFKYEDDNGDGNFDSGSEDKLSDWTIYVIPDGGTANELDPADAAGAVTQDTDVDGNYLFALPPGAYFVCEAAQWGSGGTPSTGWIQTSPQSGDIGYTAECGDGDAPAGLATAGYRIVVTSGSLDENNEFGNRQPGTKSGHKYEDLNGNGNIAEDTAHPLDGWTIRAYKDDGTGAGGVAGDGILQAGETNVADSDTTAADGSYSLTLDPGKYVVCEATQAGWSQTVPGNTVCTLVAGLEPGGYAITVTSGFLDENNDFGNFTTGTKSGHKYEDLNGNGNIAEDTAHPLDGWTIRAYKDDGTGAGGVAGDGILQAGETNVADSDTTAADGSYSLTLDPGKYVVCEATQAGWSQTVPGNTVCTLVAGLEPGGYAITVTSGFLDENNDFGNFTTGTKSGHKYEDLNGNGNIAEDTAHPLDGWTIRAYKDDGTGAGGVAGDGILQAGETNVADSDTTAADGSYSLTLDPGKYVVCEATQAGWSQTVPGNTVCTLVAGLEPGGYAITVTSGFLDENNDFGNFTTGTKSGHKYEDLNGNGNIAEDTAHPLDGWTIRAYKDDGTGAGGVAGDGILQAGETNVADSDTTAADGSYSLTLDPGKYVVCEATQAGWSQTVPGNTVCTLVAGLEPGGYAITVTSGFLDENNDFGNFTTGTKSGHKYEDLNGNGNIAEDTAHPLDGWTIRAYKDDGTGAGGVAGDGILQAGETNVADSDTTAADGSYSLTLDPGKYVVCEATQAGWSQTVPGNTVCTLVAGLEPGGYAITVTSGFLDENNDFGNFTTGTKSGHKYEDLNGNGNIAEDTAHPLDGWTIRAYKDDGTGAGGVAGDGILQAGETNVADSDTTAADGSYSLTLDPGKYVVCEATQAGWSQTVPGNTVCTLVAGLEPGGYAITVTSGFLDENNDFGNFTTGTKSGHKYEDLNGNGNIAEDTAHPLDGWTIRAYKDDGTGAGGVAGDGILQAGETNVADSDTTAADGSYSLTLDPGKYVVCEATQAGWSQTVPGNTVCTLVAGLEPGGYAITVTSGFLDENNDFGNFTTGTKSGHKYEDLNGNGNIAEDTAHPLDGWTIRAYKDDGTGAGGVAGDGILQAGETNVADSDTTAADGSYSLTLDPGKYVVCEATQAGWSQTVPGNTVCTLVAGLEPGGYAITVTSGFLDENNDFGNFTTGTKSGHKYEDLNGNGNIAEDTAHPLDGWTIRAYKDDGTGAGGVAGDGILQAGETNVADSDTTAADGSYSLTLDPGKYVVCEATQAGWSQTVPGNTVCTLVAGLEPGGYAITVTSGFLDENNDFGNFTTGTKSGHKYEDLNGNGNIAEDTAHPLDGWTIRAYKDDGTGAGGVAGDGILQAGETNVADSDTTAADGSYSLTLDPGKYVVCEATQAGWSQTVPGNTVCTLVAGLEPGGYAITVTSGFLDENNDFGNFQPLFEGCTPGFWQGGVGITLWNVANDPDWASHGGAGTNPFVQSTVFKTFFTATGTAVVDNMTMLQIVGTGGTNSWPRKAARDLIAAYLNASFGLTYPYTTTQIITAWNGAVALGTPGFQAFHTVFGAANELGCPIGNSAQ